MKPRHIFLAALFLAVFTASTAAATVHLPVGTNSTHTLTVYNPLHQPDTITLDTGVAGAHPDTFTVTSPDTVFPGSTTVRIPARTNHSVPIHLAALQCTEPRCTATVTFTASSATTGLNSEKTVSLTTAEEGVTAPNTAPSPILAVVAVAVFLGLAAAVFFLRSVLRG